MLAVVFYHAVPGVLPGGFLGVTIFFTLSGYLITDAMLRDIRRNGGSFNVLVFYKKRLRRLWPLMLLVVGSTAILAAICAPALLGKMRPDAIPALLFYENWYYIVREQSYFAASGLPSPITHFWFLSVIMQFYIIWPWIVLLLTHTHSSRVRQGRFVLVLAIISAIIAAVLFDPSGDPSRVYYGFDTRLAEILLGAWLAFEWPTDGMTKSSRSVLERLGGVGNTLITDLIALFSMVVLVGLCFTVNGYSPWLYRGGLFCVSLLTVVVIAAVVLPGSTLSHVLGVKPLVEAAKRSFGIYLWHFPLLLFMNPATRTTEVTPLGWLLQALIIIGVVELSYRLVEEPSAALLSRRTTLDEPLVRVSLAILLSTTLVGGGLLLVGPFWYKDGASQQQANTAQQTPPQQQSTTPPPSAPAPAANANKPKSVDATIKEAAESLDALINAKGYSVDPETGVTDAPVILIGDSVPAGAVDQFYKVFPKGYINAEVGRQLFDGVEVYKESLAQGYNQFNVVFSCGDNGVAVESDVENLISAAGNRKVFLVTARVPLQLQDLNNELFRKIADKHENVTLVDWYAYSDEGHDEYFWDDGTHLRPEGAEAYVAMLRDAICNPNGQEQ